MDGQSKVGQAGDAHAAEGQRHATGSPLSIASIVISMTIAAIGSGIMATYVPFELTRTGETWAASAAVPALAFGGLLGCVLAGPLIQRVGHARLFSCSMAMVIIGAVLVAADLPAAWWVLARAIYGAASNVNFIIAQSWLNHAASNEWRGRAMSFFYMAFVLGLGAGALIFGQLRPAAILRRWSSSSSRPSRSCRSGSPACPIRHRRQASV